MGARGGHLAHTDVPTPAALSHALAGDAAVKPGAKEDTKRPPPGRPQPSPEVGVIDSSEPYIISPRQATNPQ